MIELQSAQSMQVSLESIRHGGGGLDGRRTSMLRRVPEVGDWAKFPHEYLSMKDLAYLTAKTGHEFAILRGKREDILFHSYSTAQPDCVSLMMLLLICCWQKDWWFTDTHILAKNFQYHRPRIGKHCDILDSHKAGLSLAWAGAKRHFHRTNLKLLKGGEIDVVDRSCTKNWNKRMYW